MVSEKLQEVLILEDDVDFEPNFCDDLEQVLEEAHRLAPQWDLMWVSAYAAKLRLLMGNSMECSMFSYF